MSKLFTSEADLVAAYCAIIQERNANPHIDQKWVVYHETAGWDLLMSCPATGVQVGIEAKLSLNAKVLDQTLPSSSWNEVDGPDYRAILVPQDSLQHHIGRIAQHLGIKVLSIYDSSGGYGGRKWYLGEPAPDESCSYLAARWHSWLPEKRCKLPDYVPDVMGGKASPVSLTPWKVKAIKLMIVLEKRGYVTRADMRELSISPSRWTAAGYGFLRPGAGGYVECDRTPDLKAQHPRNYAEIEADFANWAKDMAIGKEAAQ